MSTLEKAINLLQIMPEHKLEIMWPQSHWL